jgi:hypothetical protein
MKPGSLLAFAFMILVALAHLLRLVYTVPITVGELAIPMWPSVLAIPLFSGVALLMWRESHSQGDRP